MSDSLLNFLWLIVLTPLCWGVLAGWVIFTSKWGETGRDCERAMAQERAIAKALSYPPKEPTYEETEAELFATLQCAEYRCPYETPPTWPLLDCDHEWTLIASHSGPVQSFCAKCPAVRFY